jgi:hypothetical protein
MTAIASATSAAVPTAHGPWAIESSSVGTKSPPAGRPSGPL